VDNVDIKSILSVLTFLAGMGSGVWGMLKWFSDSERKKYAAERAFNHLTNDQAQMKRSIEMLCDEVDELGADMKTQAACFEMLLAQSGQTISGLFAYKKRENSDANDSH
jgi:hypothetical protein